MAAKNLYDALMKSGINHEMKKAFCVGPVYELTQRIDTAEDVIIKKAQKELRDYFAHRTMIIGEKATAMDLFEDVFKNISALLETNE